MNWLTRLLRRAPCESDGPSVRLIQFDTSGWSRTRKSGHSIEWRDADGDTLCARVHPKPTERLLVLSDLESLRAFHRQEAATRGGCIISVETVHVAGIRSEKVINKYERRPAYAYDGTLTIPLKHAHYTITMDSIERGVTGERDAVVTSHLAGRGELAIAEAEDSAGARRIKGWFQDPYDPSYKGRALYSMSDDERLDALFPHHPLSKIRRCLTRVQNTLAINQAAASNSVEVPSPGEAEAAERPRHLLSSRTVASLYLLFGSSLLEAGRFDEAERLLTVSISELEHVAGVNDLLVARHLLLLGLAHDSQGRHIEAERVLSRSRGIFTVNLGDDHPETAQAALNLARVYVSLGRHAEAEPLFLQALRVFEEKQMPGSNAGVALNGLGLVYNAHGLYAQAIPCFERAHEIFESVHGPQFCDCATVLRNMAFSLQKNGDERRAKDALERARRIDRQ